MNVNPFLAFSLHGSDVAFLHLAHQIITRPDAERHDGQRRILARRRGEPGAVHDEQVLDVVRLLELIQHRFLGIASHAGNPNLVNRPTRRGRARRRSDVLAPRRFQHLAGGLRHVLHHGF